MRTPSAERLAGVAAQFRFAGRFRSAKPHGSGNIHDTYAAVCEKPHARYILQRINRGTLPNPAVSMEVIEKVIAHIRGKVGDPRRSLTLVRARDGKTVVRDSSGEYWRAFEFMGRVVTYDVVPSPGVALAAARAFGGFASLLEDIPRGIFSGFPRFHDTHRRFLLFEKALAENRSGRARGAAAEADFALRRKAMTGVLAGHLDRGGIVERVVHNDTKVNNVLFDSAGGEGLCVIDLDTVMPGLLLHDFGDLVRSAVNPAAEDERDLAKVKLRMPVFKSLARGYLETAGSLLNDLERELMPFAAKIIAFELGMRFLTDHLNGDVYFKIRRPGHNLDRCRTQFRLVELFEKNEAKMRKILATLAAAR